MSAHTIILELVHHTAQEFAAGWDRLFDVSCWQDLLDTLGSDPALLHRWRAKVVLHCLSQRSEFEWRILRMCRIFPHGWLLLAWSPHKVSCDLRKTVAA